MKYSEKKKLNEFRAAALKLNQLKSIKGGTGSPPSPPVDDPGIGIEDMVDG